MKEMMGGWSETLVNELQVTPLRVTPSLVVTTTTAPDTPHTHTLTHTLSLTHTHTQEEETSLRTERLSWPVGTAELAPRTSPGCLGTARTRQLAFISSKS